ncbi:MAG TPA: hypothetical protein VGI40_22485 [Pirellulaceae bacterium]
MSMQPSSLVPPRPATKSDTPNDGATLRGVLSLLICIHLFCVAVVLAANFRRSPLQGRLVSIFSGYTKLLHFDPEFTPYYYTLGRPSDDDTWLVIDLYPSAEQPVAQQQSVKTVRLPEGGSNWFDNRKRAFQLARLVATSAEPGNENDDLTGEIARSVGGWAMRTTGNHRAVVRCVRRMSQSLDLAALNPGFPADRPTDPAYDSTIYEADVWTDEDGQVQLLKRASRAEVAPGRTGTGAMSPTPPSNPTNN